MTDHGGVRHEYAELGEVRLHYARAGQGPLIVFLHGFPQCWYTFRHQLAEFGRDHLAIAVDLRGYNLSSKPAKLDQYGPWPAAQDIRQLVDSLGYERFVLVGHDWGAAAAWTFALHEPDLLEALVILATPHPATFDRALHEDREQQQASRYLLALRRADVEPRLAAEDFAALRATLDHPFLGAQDLARYLDSWRQPGALAGMLRWYRREGLGPAEDGTPARGNYAPQITPLTVDVPTLVIYPGRRSVHAAGGPSRARALRLAAHLRDDRRRHALDRRAAPGRGQSLHPRFHRKSANRAPTDRLGDRGRAW